MTAEDLDDVATGERRRLDRLLRIPQDDRLVPAEVEELGVQAATEWSAGFEDPETGVRVNVLFIRDPRQRNEEARRLAAEADASVLVGTNGGMLFHARAPEGLDTPAAGRLRQLAARFGGEE